MWLLPLALAACARSSAPPASAVTAPEPEEHHHELHLPPVGPTVRVALDGTAHEVTLAAVPHEGTRVRLQDLWSAAWPGVDPGALRFDLTGSDGFHPASRAPCKALLGGVDVRRGFMDVASHDVSYEGDPPLPGCYRVKAVVAMDASR
jgi:hypothetical protein